MNNYRLVIQYDGTNYSGWQIQDDNPTVQQEISSALKTLLKEDINVIGSGRTDSGVHAFGQQANFRTTSNIETYRFKHSLNAILPKDISVLEMEQVDENFHARFDAKKRIYLYFMIKYKSPFYDRYAYFYHSNTEINKLNELSSLLIRQGDFSAFSRKRSETENKVCTIYNARWTEKRVLIIFLIEADRFLHGMVRAITGTLLQAIKNNHDKHFIEEIIRSKDREAAGESVPAKGLFLYKVKYQ